LWEGSSVGVIGQGGWEEVGRGVGGKGGEVGEAEGVTCGWEGGGAVEGSDGEDRVGGGGWSLGWREGKARGEEGGRGPRRWGRRCGVEAW